MASPLIAKDTAVCSKCEWKSIRSEKGFNRYHRGKHEFNPGWRFCFPLLFLFQRTIAGIMPQPSLVARPSSRDRTISFSPVCVGQRKTNEVFKRGKRPLEDGTLHTQQRVVRLTVLGRYSASLRIRYDDGLSTGQICLEPFFKSNH